MQNFFLRHKTYLKPNIKNICEKINYAFEVANLSSLHAVYCRKSLKCKK